MLNKRVVEAASLRQFFQDQWEHLQRLIDDQQQKKTAEREQEHTVNSAVEAIVEGTDARLRGLLSYKNQLRQSARGLLDYIEDIVSEMPPPLLITKQTFIMDPMVRYVFQDEHFVNRLFHDNQSLEAFLKNQEDTCEEVYALIYFFKAEKKIFGADLWGSMLVTDVPQTIVCFVGHEVIALAATEQDLRSALKKALFESVVTYIHLEIMRIRYARTEAEHRRDALDPQSNIDNPMVYMAILKKLLASPRDLLTLNSQQLTLTKIGIKVSLDQTYRITSTDTLDLQEVSIGHKRSQVLCAVRYPINLC